jgi:hypothetical protein
MRRASASKTRFGIARARKAAGLGQVVRAIGRDLGSMTLA